jgi:hypothetical protein
VAAFEASQATFVKAAAAWEEANASATRARQDELDAGVLLKQATRANAELDAYRVQIEEAKRDGLDYSRLEVDLNTAQTQRDGLIKIDAALTAYEWAVQQYGKNLKSVERMQRNLAVMEEVCGAIETNVKYGSRDVMAVLDAHIRSLGDYFGAAIALADDYMPSMNGIPFQLLCESDQFLALVAVQYALALVSDMKFIFVDSLDRLTPERLKLLRSWMQLVVVDHGVQVVAAVARDEPTAVRKTPFHVVPLWGHSGEPRA